MLVFLSCIIQWLFINESEKKSAIKFLYALRVHQKFLANHETVAAILGE